MGLDAWVNVKFFNSENEQVGNQLLDCYKCSATCKEIKIPNGAKSLVVCFTTEYEDCDNCTD